MTVKELATAMNRLSEGHAIGQLQDLREKLRGKPSRTYSIFTATTIFSEYAFHDGGRHELQFNIGIEEMEDRDVLRYGVAFSLETSRSHPDLTELFPKIDRFNYYLRQNSSAFPGFSMWCWSEQGRSENFTPRPIEASEATIGNFIFFGKWTEADKVDIEEVLATLDEQLPLYAFVEGGDYLPTPADRCGAFHPGCTVKKASTRASRDSAELDVALRHNELQLQLYKQLCEENGADLVGTEFGVESGGRVDAVVFREKDLTFYEIKVAPSARSAIREALGQILEYSYWPEAERARELVIVGEAVPTMETIAYLNNIRRRSGLPISYRQLNTESGKLGPPV